MVETITPVVHGGRRGRWAWMFALHVLGATASAALFGAVLGVLGAFLGAPWGRAGVVLVALVALAYLAREAFGVLVPVPQLRRQVPEWWRTFFGPGPSALLYGLGLGVGFLTYLLHGTLVVVSVAAAASGRPLIGAIVMAPFGLARGTTAVVARRPGSVEGSGELVGRLALAASWRGWRLAHVIVTAGVIVAASMAIPDRAWRAADLGGVAEALLATTFSVAAVAKASRWRRWTRVLSAYDVPWPGVVAIAVPAGEASIVVMTLAGLARGAAAVAFALLAVFSAAIVIARLRRGPRLECGCFGGVESRDYRVLLARNAVLGAVAAAVWRWAPSGRPLDVLSAPGRDDVLPAALVATGLLTIVGLIALAAMSLRRPEVRS